jgi:hypothetical protein
LLVSRGTKSDTRVALTGIQLVASFLFQMGLDVEVDLMEIGLDPFIDHHGRRRHLRREVEVGLSGLIKLFCVSSAGKVMDGRRTMC